MLENTPDYESLANRLKSLERQNRVTRYLGIGTMVLLVSVMAFAWVGKAVTGARGKTAQPDTDDALSTGHFASLTTRDFQFEDDHGKLRASLGLGSEDHSKLRPVTLRLYDEAGDSSMDLEAGGSFGPALNVNRNGAGSVRVVMNGTAPLVQLLDDKGKVGAVLWFMNGSPHLILTDDKGRTRAVFGYEAGWPSEPGRPESDDGTAACGGACGAWRRERSV